ncbi:MAG: TMEM175 family protein [Thermoleophilia bacterium]
MPKGRLEAFSDGVIAIIITIMVLELKVPESAEFAELRHLWPKFLSYVLSFLYVGIYWNNHHHMLHAARTVSGAILWANLNLLFWLSLLPFTTGWMGENHFARNPTVLYGINLLACAIAYTIFLLALVRLHGHDSALAREVDRDRKGKISVAIYVTGLAAAIWVHPWVAVSLFAVVSLIWLVPDRRMERAAAA